MPISRQPTLFSSEDQWSALAHLEPIYRGISHYCHWMNHLDTRGGSKTCQNWFNIYSAASVYCYCGNWCSAHVCRQMIGAQGRKRALPLIIIKSDYKICRWSQETADKNCLMADASQYNIRTGVSDDGVLLLKPWSECEAHSSNTPKSLLHGRQCT